MSCCCCTAQAAAGWIARTRKVCSGGVRGKVKRAVSCGCYFHARTLLQQRDGCENFASPPLASVPTNALEPTPWLPSQKSSNNFFLHLFFLSVASSLNLNYGSRKKTHTHTHTIYETKSKCRQRPTDASSSPLKLSKAPPQFSRSTKPNLLQWNH